LRHDDFTCRFIEHGTSSGTPSAAVDWMPRSPPTARASCPAQPARDVFLAAATSIATSIPVDLRNAATGLDARNIHLLITAISPPPDSALGDSGNS